MFSRALMLSWLMAMLLITSPHAMAADAPITLRYDVPKAGNVSIAVYDAQGVMLRTLKTGEHHAAGSYTTTWDGLNRYGQPASSGQYQWRMLVTPGLTAKFIGALGTNSVPQAYMDWYGNHSAPNAAVTDGQWLYMGTSAENVPASVAVSMEGDVRRWDARQRLVAGKSLSMVLGEHEGKQWLFDLSAHKHNMELNVIDPATGKVNFEMDARWDADAPRLSYKAGGRGGRSDLPNFSDSQMTLAGSQIVISYMEHDTIRFIDLTRARQRGKDAQNPVVRQVRVEDPIDMAGTPDGRLYVITNDAIVRVMDDDSLATVIPASELVSPHLIAYEPRGNQLLVAQGAPSHVIRRFDLTTGKFIATYGREGGRLDGPFNPDDFMSINDVTPDGHGGFIVNTPMYRITGWNGWHRSKGDITLDSEPGHASFDGNGLRGAYYKQAGFQGQPVTTQVDEQVWFNVRNGRPINGSWEKDEVVKGIGRNEAFAVRWTGKVTSPFTEAFRFSVTNFSQQGPTKSEGWREDLGGARVWIDGQLVLDQWKPELAGTNQRRIHTISSDVHLKAGKQYDIVVEYANWGQNSEEPAEMSLLWESFTLERQRVPKVLLSPQQVSSND